jgi:hypothetical protein
MRENVTNRMVVFALIAHGVDPKSKLWRNQAALLYEALRSSHGNELDVATTTSKLRCWDERPWWIKRSRKIKKLHIATLAKMGGGEQKIKS